MKTKNSTYLILTLVLLILSAIGAYFLYQLYQDRQSPAYNSATVPKIELIPTDALEPEIIDIPDDIATPAAIVTASATKTITPTIYPTLIPTKAISPTSTPITTPTVSPATGSTQTYTSQTDNFSVAYAATRQFYQDTEPSGNRYTFTLSSGNFAVHVSAPPQWSWTHPDREFTNTLLVSGKPTFKYETATQTIVDLQSSTKNYTIQCIHNGISALKTECTQFINSFKLL